MPYAADRLSPNTNMDFSAAVAPSAQSMKNETKILIASGIGKTVRSGSGELAILRDIDLAVTSGEALAVVGASGSGKSTLLALLAGLDTPTSGSVTLDGVDIFALDEDRRAELRGRVLGFVFQSFQLLPALTALENVALPLELAGNDQAEELARQMLVRVGLGERRLLRRPRRPCARARRAPAARRRSRARRRPSVERANHVAAARRRRTDRRSGQLHQHGAARRGDATHRRQGGHRKLSAARSHPDRTGARRRRCSRRARASAGQRLARRAAGERNAGAGWIEHTAPTIRASRSR